MKLLLLFSLLQILGMAACDRSITVTSDWPGGRTVEKYYLHRHDSLNYNRKVYFANGDLATKGKVRNGRLHGHWIWWYENGHRKAEAYMDHGYYRDERRKWYRNGMLKLIHHIDEPCRGEWCDGLVTRYDSSGNITQQYLIKKGRRDGIHTLYYPSGEIFKKTTYLRGVQHGPYREYRADGSLLTSGYFRKNSMHGKWMWYNEFGQIETTEYYDVGHFVDNDRQKKKYLY